MANFQRDIVVIGASAGGVPALQRLVAGLGTDLPASIFIVMHVWSRGSSFLPAILASAGALPVVEAQDGAAIKRGWIYTAPSDQHMLVEPERVRVLRGPRENRARPAINPLFRSAASAYRNRVIGVILTGMLDDGAAGLWAVKQCGGVSIVQADPEFASMPKTALEGVPVDYHVPLHEIPAVLHRVCREVVAEPDATVPEVIKVNDGGARSDLEQYEALDRVGKRSLFSCPECDGALWELEEGSLQYRCHVGHSYSAEVLGEEKDGSVEASLWGALRALKESAALDGRLATRSAEHGLDQASRVHAANAEIKFGQAERLQQFLLGLRSKA
jgi:two-component system, chemotaxis family, protein-glutamate methylesterase/glutaminase